MFEYAKSAQQRGLQAIIAGAGGAAHLPGMVASQTTLPVLGVPVPSKYLRGEDSLLSIVQMPKRRAGGHVCDWRGGRGQCGLVRCVAAGEPRCRPGTKIGRFRTRQTQSVLDMTLPAVSE